jgi:hypothetical protein
MVAAAMLLFVGCMPAEPALVALPSAPPPPATAEARREAARLQREGLRVAARPAPARDPDLASALIEGAARLGDPDAQLLLAAGHLYGGNGPANPAAAIPWLHRAAQQGQPEAQFRLARLLEAGEGTRRDPAWAAVWFQRAAERGHPEAHFALALLQVIGEGTARDEAEALARLAIAEQRGVTAARRYREALERRVPAPQARVASSRIRTETARGPVPEVDRALVRFTQSALATQGMWPARVDGRDGPEIRGALTAYARRQGLGSAAPYGPVVIDRLREPLTGA